MGNTAITLGGRQELKSRTWHTKKELQNKTQNHNMFSSRSLIKSSIYLGLGHWSDKTIQLKNSTSALFFTICWHFLDHMTKWKTICRPMTTTKQHQVDMCNDHREHKGPCGWNGDKWKTILGVYLSKCAHSFFPYFLFIAPAVVYLLFDCTLTGVKKNNKRTLHPWAHKKTWG